MKLRNIFGLITTLYFIAAPVNAAFISGGSGSKQYVEDTATGLKWLQLTNSDNMLYADALAAHPNYQLATVNQVETLFTNAGFTNITHGCCDTQNGLESLVDSFFLTFTPNYVDLTSGFYLLRGWLNNGDGTYGLGLIDKGEQYGWQQVITVDYNHETTDISSRKQSGVAYWLIQTNGSTPTIPEPATIALLGFGFAGMGYIQRRRKSV